MRYFVGYDERYKKDFESCVESLHQKAERTPNELIEREQDGSTQFTYSRFLIPHVCNFTGWALYCDSDFIFIEDVQKLIALCDEKYAVMVCKHPSYTTKTLFKMQGQKQTNYDRKNWSSLILWNCNHPANLTLDQKYVNTALALDLHQFKWLDDTLIGSIPLEWNTLVGYYHFTNPLALHYTDGTENMI